MSYNGKIKILRVMVLAAFKYAQSFLPPQYMTLFYASADVLGSHKIFKIDSILDIKIHIPNRIQPALALFHVICTL